VSEAHIRLAIHGSRGSKEPVHADALGGARYRVLSSPGFVLGVAAGDEIELVDDEGHFRVVRRGGNIVVQLFSKEPVESLRESLARDVLDELGGVLDGGIERGLVFTIPVTSGFAAIEALFDDVVGLHPETEWMYGNVYDPDTGEPLGWWDSATVRPRD
jgi:hypothetical protein